MIGQIAIWQIILAIVLPIIVNFLLFRMMGGSWSPQELTAHQLGILIGMGDIFLVLAICLPLRHLY